MTRKQKWTTTTATAKQTIGENFKVLKLKEFLLHIERWIEYHDNGIISLPLFRRRILSTLRSGRCRVGVRFGGNLMFFWIDTNTKMKDKQMAHRITCETRKKKQKIFVPRRVHSIVYRDGIELRWKCMFCAMLLCLKNRLNWVSKRELLKECRGDAQRIHN